MHPNGYTNRAHIRLPLPEGYFPIPDYPGYAINRTGTILSQKSGRWRPLAVFLRNGYRRASLWRSGKMCPMGVHRLLLLAFIGPCPDGLECRHLDGDPLNNDLSNLAWGTVQENADDRIRHGTVRRGEEGGNARLTQQQVKGIMHRLAAGDGKHEIATAAGIAVNTVYAINQGRLWAHIPSPTGGYPIGPDRRKQLSEAQLQLNREKARRMREARARKRQEATSQG